MRNSLARKQRKYEMAKKLKNNKSNTIKKKKSKKRKFAGRKPYKFTEERKTKWLKIFAATKSVSASCQAVCINRSTVYEHKKLDPEFARKWDEEEEKILDAVESKLYVNAINGNMTAIIFTLCNRRPDRWKNVQRVEHGGKIKQEVSASAELMKLLGKKDKDGRTFGEKVRDLFRRADSDSN